MSRDWLTNNEMDRAVEAVEAHTQAVIAANAQRLQAEDAQRARQVLASTPDVKAVADAIKTQLQNDVAHWQKEALAASLAGDSERCAQALQSQAAAIKTLSDKLP